MDGKMALYRKCFSELYEIVVNKVSFVSFKGVIARPWVADPVCRVVSHLGTCPEKRYVLQATRKGTLARGKNVEKDRKITCSAEVQNDFSGSKRRFRRKSKRKHHAY